MGLEMNRKRTAVRVRAEWDQEARVWVAESGNLPGLVTEAETVEQLFEKLRPIALILHRAFCRKFALPCCVGIGSI